MNRMMFGKRMVLPAKKPDAESPKRMSSVGAENRSASGSLDDSDMEFERNVLAKLLPKGRR
jgi:hypothetical protein